MTPRADPSEACEPSAAAPSPLRRLTHREYDNAIAELLGDTSKPATAFPTDNEVGLFDNTASAQTISPLLGEYYLNVAASLAERADVSSLLGCEASDATCVQTFVERFGRRALRRPLDEEEARRYFSIYTSAAAQSDSETGVRAVLAAFLTSPHFLFRPEFGVAGAGSAATSFEVATRLASFLWASIPDDELLDAAAGGELNTAEGVTHQAERMVNDSRARAASLDFFEQWLGLRLLENATKNGDLYPEFDDHLREAMRQEVLTFVDHVVWESDATAHTLLSASHSFVNAELAAVYGVPMPPGALPGELVRVELPPGERAGILTFPGILAALASPGESNPFKRGVWVRTRLLCNELPDPPNEVPPLPELEEGVSNRQRAALHSSVPACKACHYLIDDIGFGFENYDAIGRYRTVDRGIPIDSSGELTQTTDADGPFENGVELTQRLSGSAQVRDCVATQWARYSLARELGSADACWLSDLREEFARSGGDMRALLVKVATTPAFLGYGGS